MLTTIEPLYQKVLTHIDQARTHVRRTVDTEMVKAYWLIGRDIVEEEQKGEKRAEYGKSLLIELSKRLQAKFKRGFSVDTLGHMRLFYLVYQGEKIDDKISDALRPKLEVAASLPISETLSRKSESDISIYDTVRRKSGIPIFNPNLSWTHYRELMRVDRVEARNFYEIEAIQNHWSARELKRQIGSLLFDRLAKSKDKEGVLALACKGQEITRPEEVIKDPF